MINPAQSSGLLAADGIVYAGPCYFWGVVAGADNTNAGSVILYDNASAASGTVISKVIVDATTTNAGSMPGVPVYCKNGLYLDIGGTGAECVVYFSAG